MSENLLEEIYRIENRFLSASGASIGINIDDIDSPNFNVDRFIVMNFSLRDKDKYDRMLDIAKVEKSLEYFHDVQKGTCEEIVDSIDKNLEKYIEISTQFEKMKDKLNKTSHKFEIFNNEISDYTERTKTSKEKVQDTVGSYSTLLNLESINSSFKTFINILRNCHETVVNLEKTKNLSLESYLDDLLLTSFKYSKADELFQCVIKKNALYGTLESKFAISSKIGELKLHILAQLGQAFSQYIQKFFIKEENQSLTDKKSIRRILQSYAHLSSQNQAEFIFKRDFFQKIVTNAAAKAKEVKGGLTVAPNQEDSSGHKLPLRVFFDTVLASLSTGIMKDLLEITEFSEDSEEHMSSQVEGYNMLLHVVWNGVFEILLHKDFNMMYSVGIPDLFNLNFKISLNFINQLRTYFKNQKNLKGFIAAETMKKFLSKWATATYFQLRMTEAAKDLDKKLVYPSESASLNDLVWKSIEKLLQASSFNLYITPKFLKLVFLMAGRYCNFIKQVVGAEFQKENADQTAIIKLVIDLSAFGVKIQEQLPRLVADAIKRDEDMIGLDKSSVEEPAQLAERVKALMGEFQNLIEQSLRQAVQPVSELIYKQCQKNLEPFNGVPAKYRMTNKEMPTTPSNFVWNIFYPLNQFIQNNRLEGQVKRVVEFNVVNKIYDKFVLIAREILDTVQKAESVLSKYKHEGDGRGGEEHSDFVKIRKQFYLDNIEFAKIASQYGQINIENFDQDKFS